MAMRTTRTPSQLAALVDLQFTQRQQKPRIAGRRQTEVDTDLVLGIQTGPADADDEKKA